MSPRNRSLLLMGAQLLLVLSLWGKLHYDRARLPRYWIQAAPVDPELPLRGRYLSLAPVLPIHGFVFPALKPRPIALASTNPWPNPWETHSVTVKLQQSSQELVAEVVQDAPASNPYEYESHLMPGFKRGSVAESERNLTQDQWTVRLNEQVPYFIPENVQNPAHVAKGETLWMEVNLPPKGPFRVIRLAIKDAKGSMRVLPY